MVEVALETINLSMRFGGICAVDNVDFKLNAGELRCLIGPNGAGKSNLMDAISFVLGISSKALRGEDLLI